MAHENTPLQTFCCAPRKRMTTEDAEVFSTLAAQMDENHIWSIVADFPCTIYGWQVSPAQGTLFQISKGAGLLEGCLVKTTERTLLGVEPETTGQERIDRIEIRPRVQPRDPLPVGIQEVEEERSPEVLLGAISRVEVQEQLVGVGDGQQTRFELEHKGVDLRTLRVQLQGTPVGGWNLSAGTGASQGHDEVIFGSPPLLGAEVKVWYTFQTGGAESIASVPTRKRRAVQFHLQKGLPGVGPLAWTPGSIRIAEFVVPAGWGMNSIGLFPRLRNGVKDFLIDVDEETEYYAPGKPPHSGRLSYPVRGMDQVLHGCRLVWNKSRELEVTPGWGVLAGFSFRQRESYHKSLFWLNVSEGWYYVYGQIDTRQPGLPFRDVVLVPVPPNQQGRHPGYRLSPQMILPAQDLVYLGAVWVNQEGKIRPFYSHGHQIWWAAPKPLDGVQKDTQGQRSTLDLAKWLPATGRLGYLQIQLDYQESGRSVAGAFYHCEATSHIPTKAESRGHPRLGCYLLIPQVNIGYREETQGWIRAEENYAGRWISYSTRYLGNPSHYEARLCLQGYLDDYRTMDERGESSFY